MPDKEKTLGEFIRRERESKGLTLREMARQIRVSPAFLSKVETQGWKPGEDRLREIAKVLKCDTDELLALARKVSSELAELLWQNPRPLAAILRIASSMTHEKMESMSRMTHNEMEEMVSRWNTPGENLTPGPITKIQGA